jgi:hypothetical protein
MTGCVENLILTKGEGGAGGEGERGRRPGGRRGRGRKGEGEGRGRGVCPEVAGLFSSPPTPLPTPSRQREVKKCR